MGRLVGIHGLYSATRWLLFLLFSLSASSGSLGSGIQVERLSTGGVYLFRGFDDCLLYPEDVRLRCRWSRGITFCKVLGSFSHLLLPCFYGENYGTHIPR